MNLRVIFFLVAFLHIISASSVESITARAEVFCDEGYDVCGVCGGNGTTCCNNYLNVDNYLWDYILLPDAVSDMISRLERLHGILAWIHDNLPEYTDIPSSLARNNQIGALAEINRMFLQDCGLEAFCTTSGQFLTELKNYEFSDK